MRKPFLFIVFTLIAVSCTQDFDKYKQVVNPEEPSFSFDVPTLFDWNIYKKVNLDIKVADQYDSRFNYVVEILSEDKLLDRGIAVNGSNYVSNVVLLKGIDTLTVAQVDPNGNRAWLSVPLSNNNLIFDFNSLAGEESSKVSRLNKERFLEDSDEPDFNIPSNAKLVPADGILKEDEIYYIPKGNQSSDIKFASDSKLYIEGSCNVSSYNSYIASSDVEIFVLPEGKLVFEGNTILFSSTNIYNKGSISVSGVLELRDENEIFNDGTFDVSDGIQLRGDGEIYNYHFMRAYYFDISSSEVINYGALNITNNINLSWSSLYNADGARISGYNFYSASSEILLEPHSIMDIINNFTSNYSTIKTTNSSKFAAIIAYSFHSSSKKDIKGKICIDTTLEPTGYGKNWLSNVVIGNPGKEVISIPSSKYNDGGYNADPIENPDVNPTPADTIAYFNPTYTIMMEDNFPKTGDMDMNDIVIDWKLGYQKNVDNKIIKIGLSYSIKALGCSKKLAGAVKISEDIGVKSAKLSKEHLFNKYFNVSNGLEQDNENVVIPLFEDVYQYFNLSKPEFVNVFNNKPLVSPYEFNVEIELNTPLEVSQVSFDKFDFFLIIEGNKILRTEIHIFGGSTTSKAKNITDFSKNSEAIWGLQFGEEVNYPIEYTPINEAYPEFQSWVESNGQTNIDWYKNPNEGRVIISK